MPKKIEIPSCVSCPHYKTVGVHPNLFNVPLCDKRHAELGHTVDVNVQSRTITQTARYDGVIPAWCPLPEDKGAQLHDALVGLIAASTYQGGPTLDRQSLQKLIEVYNDPA